MAKIEGRVETPETPQPPSNYIVQAAMRATPEELDKLIEHARVHGYSLNGQTMQFLQARRADLASGKPAITVASRRGGKR